MRELFKILGNALKNGQDAALVTVVADSGSTPRGAGARMIITREGRLYGTIGGGAVEYRCEQMAAEMLGTGSSGVEYFQLSENQIRDLGMVCGGNVTVYFQFIPAYDAALAELCGRIESLYEDGEDSWIICDVTGNGLAVYSRTGGLHGISIPGEVIKRLSSGSELLASSGHDYFIEKIINSGRVYIFGGGHVAQALVPALAAVDFRCVVLEDREAFCRLSLFPGAEEVRLIDNSRIGEFVSICENDYVVIMTRGHMHDQLIMAQALKTAARYIGVIGSARKKASVFAKLRDEGFTDSDLARITTPIGLAIKAETPREIAVSITAQLILKRAELTER